MDQGPHKAHANIISVTKYTGDVLMMFTSLQHRHGVSVTLAVASRSGVDVYVESNG